MTDSSDRWDTARAQPSSTKGMSKARQSEPVEQERESSEEAQLSSFEHVMRGAIPSLGTALLLLVTGFGCTGPDTPECTKNTYYEGTVESGEVVETCKLLDTGEEVDCDACIVVESE